MRHSCAMLMAVVVAGSAAAGAVVPRGRVPGLFVDASAPVGLIEPPHLLAGVSMDQAIEMTERRYRARVVRAETIEAKGRRVYVLRLLSEGGRVWTIRVDAETGGAL